MTALNEQMPDAATNLVYVRPVRFDTLPAELQERVTDVDELYAVHNAMGDRLALVKDRALAFVVARQNDMAPVSVH